MTYFNQNSNTVTKIYKTTILVAMSFFIFGCNEKNKSNVKNASDATFYIDTAAGEFNVVDTNVQGQANKKLVAMTVCLKDNAQTNSINNLNFKVHAGDVTTVKKTDRKGCLYWNELLEFNPQDNETNVFMTRKIEATESHSGTEKLVFSVNPWKDSFPPINPQSSSSIPVASEPASYKIKDVSTQSEGLNYNYDIYVKISPALSASVKNSKNYFHTQSEIGRLTLHFADMNYSKVELDQKLNVTFPFEYNTEFNISILRQNLNQLAGQSVLMGNFQFYLVFLKDTADFDSIKDNDIIGSTEFKASPYGTTGKINVPIKIKFTNIAALSSRLKVMFSMYSLDESTNLGEQNFVGNIQNLVIGSSYEITLNLSQLNAKDFHLKNQAYLEKLNNEKIDVKTVLKNAGYQPFKKSNVSFSTKEYLFFDKKYNIDLLKLIESLDSQHEFSKSEKQALCVAFFDQNYSSFSQITYQKCLNRPEKILSAELNEFVESVKSDSVEAMPLSSETLDINSIFSTSRDDSSKSGHSVGGNIKAEVDGNVGVRGGLSSKPIESLIGNADCKINDVVKEKDQNGNEIVVKPAENKCFSGVKGQIGGNLSLNLNGNAFFLNEFVLSENNKKEISVISTERVTSSAFKMSFNAQVKKCLLVSLNDDLKKKTNELKTPASKYLCTLSYSANREENYFLIDHDKYKESNSVLDKASSVANPFRMLVRGQKSYDFLKSIVTNDKVMFNIILWKWTAEDNFRNSNVFLSQDLPLMLSSTKKTILKYEENSKLDLLNWTN